ncbi:orf190 (mitochondrion) [Beta vulgaris subsp. vulgaris]|uniref:Orf190 protein n=1 Tax=Beta vulgaris subsp. vulgaris TaxID=3555 RepID=Q9MF60_BETVV|nr:orf190 [Beta vulgaris subsp. vulgaris]BAA99475.1 orf190 [Beta vulgaris subsp. vulgaris]
MLAEHKNMHHDEDQLRALQAKVEDLTMKYNEECLFAGNPSLLERFIKSDLPNARDYLKGKYKLDKVDDNLDRIKVLPYDKGQRTPPADGYKDLLNEADKELINSYGCHDIEAILIHILSCLFNVESSVSCATLIEKIEHLARTRTYCIIKAYPVSVKSPQILSLRFLSVQNAKYVILSGQHWWNSWLKEI